MATQKFLVTTDNTDMSAHDMAHLIEKHNVIGERPEGTTVVDVTDAPQPTTTQPWKVKQNGNTVASALTSGDGLTILHALATADSGGLDGWSLHFDMAVS